MPKREYKAIGDDCLMSTMERRLPVPELATSFVMRAVSCAFRHEFIVTKHCVTSPQLSGEKLRNGALRVRNERVRRRTAALRPRMLPCESDGGVGAGDDQTRGRGAKTGDVDERCECKRLEGRRRGFERGRAR